MKATGQVKGKTRDDTGYDPRATLLAVRWCSEHRTYEEVRQCKSGGREIPPPVDRHGNNVSVAA
jgi:hypothetical protein